jgi:hypothetical protein
VDYNVMSIQRYGVRSNPDFYPQIDKEGNFLLEKGEGSIASAKFSNIKVTRNGFTEFESEHALDGKLYITDCRIVLMSEDYQSGGAIWVGGLAGAVIATVASSALAKKRTEGTVLAGHLRYEWLENVSVSSEKLAFKLFDEVVTFSYRDCANNRWSVIVTLDSEGGLANKVGSEIEKRRTHFEQLHPGAQGRVGQAHRLPAQAGKSSAAAGQASTGQVFCTQCGGKIKETDAFCKHCGAKQQ